LIQNFLCKAVS